MKMKFKLLAAAVALAFAGSANAAMQFAQAAPGGDLWLNVWDKTGSATSWSYTLDLGVRVDTFIANQGTNQSFAIGDALWQSSVGTATQSNLLWNVSAGEVASSSRSIISVNGAVPTGTNAANNTVVNVLGGLSGLYGQSIAGLCPSANECATQGTGPAAAAGTGWGDNMGGSWGFGTTKGISAANPALLTYTLGSGDLAAWQVVNNGRINTAPAVFTQLGNGTQFGFFSIVPSSVPLPAAAWLFGSGLLGLVGVARRRNDSPAA